MSSIRENTSDSQGKDRLIIQCPDCATRFAIDSGTISGMENPKFHCSRCDTVFQPNDLEILSKSAPSSSAHSSGITSSSHNLSNQEGTEGEGHINSSRFEDIDDYFSSHSEEDEETEDDYEYEDSEEYEEEEEDAYYEEEIEEEEEEELESAPQAKTTLEPDAENEQLAFGFAKGHATDEGRGKYGPRFSQNDNFKNLDIEFSDDLEHIKEASDNIFGDDLSLQFHATKEATPRPPIPEPEIDDFGEMDEPEHTSRRRQPVNGFLAGSVTLALILCGLFIVVVGSSSNSTLRNSLESYLGLSSNLKVAPQIGFTNMEFEPTKLADGQSVGVLKSTLVNRGDQTASKLVVEGLVFDKDGRVLRSLRVPVSATIKYSRISSLSLNTIKEMQSGLYSKPFALEPGEKYKIAVVFPNLNLDRAKSFSARAFVE